MCKKLPILCDNVIHVPLGIPASRDSRGHAPTVAVGRHKRPLSKSTSSSLEYYYFSIEEYTWRYPNKRTVSSKEQLSGR